MSTEDTAGKEDNNVSVCANCGKGEEESDSLKTCTACKMVKYCNRECQIAHRPQHKKECKKRAAELHEEALFKHPPPEKDCPICFIRLPALDTGQAYMSCCGKVICSGCIHAPLYNDQGNEVDNQKCPFCRTPSPKSIEEENKRARKRMQAGDAEAFNMVAGHYVDGTRSMPQDWAKANELYLKAGELGFAGAYHNLGNSYYDGRGVEVDKKKAVHYFELAAMGGRGNEAARHNLGNIEGQAGNHDRALKHFMIAVKYGCNYSLETIRVMYSCGNATKDDYIRALRAYQTYSAEIKSKQRDEAAAYSDKYKYIE